MAMMDDANFLINHIRNSFVTSDDTGMCELIIEHEEREHSHRSTTRYIDHYGSDSGMESSDHDLSGSMEILPDMGYGHRRRSNTAQRLERLRKEKRSQRKVKHIPWRDGPTNFSDEERAQLFERKSLPDSDEVQGSPMESKGLSKLAFQLEKSAGDPDNPFMEYSKFDGKASMGVPSKTIAIFLTMASAEDRPYPMTVQVLASAKIQELIGLICWQYTTENREPKLNDNIEVYCLNIVEDDGEVDMDFPSLDNREPVSKFGFSKLALVEKNTPPPKSSLVVTVYVPLRGFNKFQVDSMNVTMKEILNRVIKRRKVKMRPGQNYNLEKQSESGVAVDLDATLATMDTMEFCLVRENSTRGEPETPDESSDHSSMAESLTSHQYKCYMVSLVHKLRSNTDVQLGISGEKVEIDPVNISKGTGRLFRQKAVTYEADSIASCEILDEKPAIGKSIFRMTHLSSTNDYKHHDFETDTDTANEIVNKMNNILELRLSPVRKEYVAVKTRKMRKRDSIKLS